MLLLLLLLLLQALWRALACLLVPALWCTM
jgi:hypothetical protein